jgi:Flp pilus assembly pilin Flp
MTNRRRVPRSDVIRGGLGQGLVEYALILVLIAIVAIVALVFLGGNVSKYLSAIGTSI